MESKSCDISIYNKLEYSVSFTQPTSFLEGVDTSFYRKQWIDKINNDEYKCIDVFYGCPIYIFKYSEKLYLINMYNNEVKYWKEI